MPDTQSARTYMLGLIAIVAVAGATITATVTNSIPHEMLGLAASVAGYLIGYGHGTARAELSARHPPPS